MRRIIFASIFAGFTSVPYLALAQTGQDLFGGIVSFSVLVDAFTGTIIKSVATLLLSLALLAFFYGVVQYVWGLRDGDSKKVEQGNLFLRWGLVALFVMFSVYGIIKFGQGILFNGKDVNTITIPDISFRRPGASDLKVADPLVPSSGNGASTLRQNSGNGAGGYLLTPQQSAQQTYNNCIGSGASASQCQSKYQAAGGSGNAKQDLAQQAYDQCIGNGASASQCTSAYQAYGGTGNPQENLASEAYNTCIGNGNSASQCEAAYKAYGGTGSGAQNLAQDAYSTCIGNGNTPEQCNAAYNAYGGTGTSATEANSQGVCPSGYVPDDNAQSGCSPVYSSSESSTRSSGLGRGEICTSDRSGCASGLTCTQDYDYDTGEFYSCQ